MKRLLFGLLALTCLFPACQDKAADASTDTKGMASTYDYVASPDQDTARYVPLYIHQMPPEDEINNSTTALGAFGQVLEPPMEQQIPQLLCKSFWVVEGYADRAASRPQKIAGTGQWIQCFPNGTFYGGHWEKQTHSGAWYMDYQRKHPRLTLDSNVDQLDSVWEIQGVTADGETMAWVRTNDGDFGPKRQSIHAKWIKLDNRPTKQQFAGIHDRL